MGQKKKRKLMVFLAGELRSSANVQALIREGDFEIYAADGGYLYAQRLDLNPTLVFGDFDSSDKPSLDSVLVYPCEKDQTDSEIALDLAKERGFDDVWFIAPFGGRLDHTLANLALLRRAKKMGIALKLYDGENLAFITEQGIHHLRGNYHYVSFLPCGASAVISLSGFKYPLRQFELPHDSTIGISNEPLDEPIVTVDSGSVLCICIENNQEEV